MDPVTGEALAPLQLEGLPRDPTAYVTRVRVRVSNTIRIGYTDTHFLKINLTKMVYPSIRIRVSNEYRIWIRHLSWSIHVT
jgi:hypothetical protein